MNFSSVFKVILSFIMTLQSQLAWSQSNSYFEVKEPQMASEFIYKSSNKDTLVGVQLLGAVKKPGIYYIPPQTDLLKLITLAGGESNADLSAVIVKKNEATKAAVYEVDLEKIMKSTQDPKPFKFAQDDFVYVPEKEPFISNDISKTITIVSLITSIILTSVLIEKNSN